MCITRNKDKLDNIGVSVMRIDIRNTEQIKVSKQDIEAILDYLWADERREYHAQGKPDNHIFENLLTLKQSLLLSSLFTKE